MSQEIDVSTPDAALNLIKGGELVAVEDSEAAQFAIAQQILESGDIGEAFKERRSISSRDLVGKPIRINGYIVRRSTVEGKEGNYLLLDCIDLDTGEVFVMNTGAVNIVALILRASQLGVIPMEVTVQEAAKAKPGRNAPLTLRPHGKTAELIEGANSRAKK